MSLTKVTYSMINGSPVNILDFGADPTGTIDSTNAIQSALDSATSIFVPDGVYLISNTLNITNNGTYLFGTENAQEVNIHKSYIKLATGIDKDLVNITANQVVLKNLCFRGSVLTDSPQTNGGNGIVVKAANGNGYYQNVAVTHIKLDGWRLETGGANQLDRCYAGLCGQSSLVVLSNDNKITNSEFQECSLNSSATYPSLSISGYNNTLINNRAGSENVGINDNCCVLETGSSGTKLIGNDFQQNNNHSVIVLGSNHQLVGNSFVDSDYGIWIKSGLNHIVTNNKIRVTSTSNYGIKIGDSGSATTAQNINVQQNNIQNSNINVTIDQNGFVNSTNVVQSNVYESGNLIFKRTISEFVGAYFMQVGNTTDTTDLNTSGVSIIGATSGATAQTYVIGSGAKLAKMNGNNLVTPYRKITSGSNISFCLVSIDRSSVSGTFIEGETITIGSTTGTVLKAPKFMGLKIFENTFPAYAKVINFYVPIESPMQNFNLASQDRNAQDSSGNVAKSILMCDMSGAVKDNDNTIEIYYQS